jgi:four helix bundle protein
MNDNILYEKSKKFAIRIIKLCNYLKCKKASLIHGQLFRSGTSIGANIAESKYATSKADFISKLHIATKETSETEYWLTLLKESNILTDDESKSILFDCKELLKMLTAALKTSKKGIEKEK